MDINELHEICKKSTRNAFEEYKRLITVDLFPFNKELNDNYINQMSVEITAHVVKHMINKHNLSTYQLRFLDEVLSKYVLIAIKTANNYSKKLKLPIK